MRELLAQVAKPGIVDNCCILEGAEITVSTFSSQQRNHETVAKKAFSYVFQNVSKIRTNHNEAHLEIGSKRLSGFILQDGRILICMSGKETNVGLVRDHVALIKPKFEATEESL
ncbi:hypothetical protein ACQUQP_16110 [Marinobacterium sp. YM272]|uniref:hypothetical protein n=1 Tax=Marinobacterium sp. YM272 TaxID=3421654 RepID=UPI003D7FC0D5